MSEDNNKIGATITYDSPHALDAARKYKEQIAAQLGHKLASRPYTPAEQRRNAIGTKLLDATQGKASLPQNIAAAYPVGSAPSKTGADYSGWHRTRPVKMSGALDDEAWVKGAYTSLLGRDADPQGLAQWKGDLASGQTRDQVVSNMKLAPEYRDKFVGEAYKNLLGRDVGLEGIDYWSKQMESGQSEDSIIANIKRSDEYGRRQQNLMRDSITPKDPTKLLNETYDDQIATYGRAYQTAQDAVQKDFGTSQDYSPLLTTDQSIYTQDPEASQMASVNYLATQDPSDSSPSIWNQALKDAGAEAISGIAIPGIVSGFFNSKKANKNAQQSLDNYVNYF